MTAFRARSGVPELPSNDAQLAQWLGGLRGGKVEIRVPQRGDKAALLETVRQNAEQSMKLHKSRRAGDLTARSVALQELQEALDLPVPLLRIECFDISHVQGTNVVASMVVVEDGLPKKSEYRKFAITGDAAVDDTASMYDVISRRFRNYLQETTAAVPETGEITGQPAAKAKFAYPPNLERWTAASRRWRPPPAPWPTWELTTCTWWAWPSAWRRCGCRKAISPSFCRAPRRGSTCCSGSAMRRTASPSPSTGRSGPNP